MISVYDPAALDLEARRRRIAVRRLDPMRRAFFTRSFSAVEARAALAPDVREAIGDDVEFHLLDLHGRHDSAADGATRLTFLDRSGRLLETVVLRIASGRTTVCVSSQIGCAAGCVFCATGRAGLTRSLRAGEMLDQLVQSNSLLRAEGRRARNVVFMGMGEPLDNEAELHAALDLLCSHRGFAHPPRYVLVSTVGLPDAMVRLARAYPEVGMALSLHSARQETRRRLVPRAVHHDVATLREALQQAARLQRMHPMIEVVMLDGLTDTSEELAALIAFLRGLDVRVNLIPFNPIAAARRLRPSPPARIAAFASALRAAGFEVTRRRSLGADVAGACGQLAGSRRASGVRGCSAEGASA